MRFHTCSWRVSLIVLLPPPATTMHWPHCRIRTLTETIRYFPETLNALLQSVYSTEMSVAERKVRPCRCTVPYHCAAALWGPIVLSGAGVGANRGCVRERVQCVCLWAHEVGGHCAGGRCVCVHAL